MHTFLLIAQLVISALLILVILSQEKGAGLSATFGGAGQLYSGRRGVDKLLLWLTVIFATLFVAIAVGSIFVPGNAPASAPSSATAKPVDVKVDNSNAKLKVEQIPVKPTPSK